MDNNFISSRLIIILDVLHAGYKKGGTVKTFLSHSSRDKFFVDKVASLLRPGTYELDSLTFEKGEMNVDQIILSLKRASLFCIFMSGDAAKSKFVELEQRLAIELVGAGQLNSVLTLCLDDEAFSQLSENAKFFNAVRYVKTPEAAAHIIKGKMISARGGSSEGSRPFIGRESELKELEAQVLDFSKPNVKALFLSGNTGVGRRSLMENFVVRQYPQVLRSFLSFEIEAYAGFDEIFRQIVVSVNSSLSIGEFVELATEFAEKSDDEKAQQIADLLNSVLNDNLMCVAVDVGGLLHESGSLSPEMDKIVDRLADHPHPPLAIISPRMTPRNVRRSAKDVAYVAVGALTREDAGRLLSWAMKSIGASPSAEQFDQLIEISDFHPFNIYEMKERIAERGLAIFLNSTASFIAWKHKETSDYLRRIVVSDEDSSILSVLLLAPELDFGSLVTSLNMDSEVVSKSLQYLVDMHVVRYSEDRFSISPPLRIAVERDARIRFGNKGRTDVINRLAATLTVLLDGQTVPIALADAAIIASLEAGGDSMHSLASALLLPSHRIWLAQRHYDAAHWQDCLRLAQDAVKDRSRLSSQGYIAGCRLLCLSSARLGKQDVFEDGISKLKSVAKDNWSKANVEFLKGFYARIRGRIIDAEKFFKSAYELNSNDRSTARELASVSLILGDNGNAEKFARKSYELATNNPYTIDILVSALVKNLGAKCLGSNEVADLIDKLKHLDDEENKSFSYTRNAEMELLYGDAKRAEKYVAEAIDRTPHLLEPKLLRAKIYLKQRRMALLKDEVIYLERATSKFAQSENCSHRRQVLLLKSEYLVETGQFKEAREVFQDQFSFSDKDRARELSKINTAEGFHRVK